ncbi:MAG: hypothetical protein SOY42_08530 [Clostridium sp.]|nr:hypothetical protein [Clostridium sp.]
MKFKKLTKVLSAVLVSSALFAAVPASAGTFHFAPTYDQCSAYYSKPVQIQDITITGTCAYIHSNSNVYRDTYATYSYTANLIVDNKSYHKTIVMHHQNSDGSWSDSDKATYVKSLGNGKELWTLNGFIDGPAQFVFNYKEANAWDNNQGQNYTLSDFRSSQY